MPVRVEVSASGQRWHRMSLRGRRQRHGGTIMKTSSWIAAVLVLALLSMGPLAPVAHAQPMQPPAPMQPATPAAPIAPDLTNQIPGKEVQPVDPPESMLMPSKEQVTSHEPTPGDATVAGFIIVVYVPGKAIICTDGVVTSTVLLLLTFGSASRQARGV